MHSVCRPWLLPVVLFCTPVLAGEHASHLKPDVAGLIECRRQGADFRALTRVLDDPLTADHLRWQRLPEKNLYMTEYRLAEPVTVFGHRSQHIAFTGDSIMAILDLPDPRDLANQLQLETAIDTPQKAMFGKEIRNADITLEASDSQVIESVILNVSNVQSHPGKTLVGCSYNLDVEDTKARP